VDVAASVAEWAPVDVVDELEEKNIRKTYEASFAGDEG